MKKNKMNFWTNPENNSLKALIIVAILIIAGYFIYTAVHKNASTNTGQVIDTTSMAQPASTSTTAASQPFTYTTTVTGTTCSMDVCSTTNTAQCIPLAGTEANGTCTLNAAQPNMTAQGLYNVINSTK